MATTTRPTRAHKPAASTANPFSASAAKLIKQIQAEAREALLAELSAKDAITVLHGFDDVTKQATVTSEHLDVIDVIGNSVHLKRRHVIPDSWRDQPHMLEYWRPDFWRGELTFVDARGRKWVRELAPMVCDDFGNLVEVAA
jgi:hypothetical protein